MKKHHIFTIVFSLVFLLSLLPAGGISAQAQAPEPEITRDILYVPGEIVVGFDSDLPKAEMQTRATALAGSVGAMVVDQYANTALLSTDPSADVVALAEQLSGQNGVTFAEPNYISWIPEADPLAQAVQIPEITHRGEDGTTITRSIEELQSMRTIIKGKVKSTYPSDEYHNWGNAEIEHDIIWIDKNASPVVCVVDTGVDNKHPDLKGRIINGYDFVNNDKVPNDDNGHGTHVAGTIAAKTNNKIGPAGISNGKVLAVKALNAQGWGTDYDISKAIRYCADKTSVKVINMSLGGSASLAEYNALDYAINTKGKLVVAAAGNDMTSHYDYVGPDPLNPTYTFYAYPAAWAYSGAPSPNGPNTIHHGLLSVGASRMPTDWYERDLWVDTNGDNVKVNDELYNANDCATWFSNYGDWVEIVAPGESIYSTTPVSYPFWNNYYGGSASGYDSWNGTSMAAPHVAGAAARVWSVYPVESNAWIHDRLLDPDHSYALTYAVDPNVSDPALGYNQNIPSGPGAGKPYGTIDYEGEEIIRAPFCWPDATAPFEADQDMSNTRFLSVAAAMDRGAFELQVVDATTGLPLTGATLTAKNGITGKIIIKAKMTSATTRYVDLINIPFQELAPGEDDEDRIPHIIYVNRKGYTAGNQIIAGGVLLSPGGYSWGKGFQVGVPPKKNTTVVANWYSGYGYDLDLYAWLPASANDVVGSTPPDHPSWDPGSLLEHPYARWHRDGGNDGGSGDYLGLESITLVNYPKSQYPYYLRTYSNETYKFFLHDYAESWEDLNNAEPIIRIWNNGKNQIAWYNETSGEWEYHAYWEKTSVCAEGETWWKAATISRNGVYPVYSQEDECGTGSTDPGGVWPYASGTAIFSTNQDK